MFDTKIALIVREDLELWQKLNVTAFLASGIAGTTDGLLGAEYEDAGNGSYHPLVIQPIIIMAATADTLQRTRQRAVDRAIRMAVYIEDMFSTNHDAANREAVKNYLSKDLPLVGLAMRGERKAIDKITKGLKLHG
jgi:hypothetical protein